MALRMHCGTMKSVQIPNLDSRCLGRAAGSSQKQIVQPSPKRSVLSTVYSSELLNLRGKRNLFPHSNRKVQCYRQLTVSGALLQREEVIGHDLTYILNKTADDLEKELNGLNVFLVGMMGCGKSTVGRIMSDILGYGFFDSDTMVEKAVGTTVAEIFQEQGEMAFRDLESQAISQLSSMEGLVIATGGGAILRDENWRSMRNGVTVWIDVPLPDLARRVVSAGIGSRPILSQGSNSQDDAYDQAYNRLNTVFQRREHLYLKADVRISLKDMVKSIGLASVQDLSPEMITLQVVSAVKEFMKLKNADQEEKVLVKTGYISAESIQPISQPIISNDRQAVPSIV